MGKLEKIIVIDGKDYKLNIFIERRRSVRASFVNSGINIRIPSHLSTEEKNKVGRDMLDWAVKKIKSDPKKYSERVYKDGNRITVFGKEYIVFIENHLKQKNSFSFDGVRILFRLANHYSEDEKQNYMRKQVRKILEKNHLLELKNHVMRINETHFKKRLGNISIKHTTSRWGQCHIRKADIDFSTRLLLAPLPVIEYVIVHELTHLLHPNHSKRFWNAVSRVDPNYKSKIKWLNKYGHELNL